MVCRLRALWSSKAPWISSAKSAARLGLEGLIFASLGPTASRVRARSAPASTMALVKAPSILAALALARSGAGSPVQSTPSAALRSVKAVA
jgi:hypothetical protein